MSEPYEVLIKSESIKKNKTQIEIPGFYVFMRAVYNSLMKLPFYTGKLAEDNDRNLIRIQDLFQFYIYDAPLKIRNIISLMEIGSYFDATILFRSFVESFIVYKCYIINNDSEGLCNYFERKKKITIRSIFEKVAPGYYNSIYSELCKTTHANPLMQAVLRGNVSKDEPIKTNLENININWFSYISNQLMPLIKGIIELYKLVYPYNLIEKDEGLKKDIDYIYNFIEEDINDRKRLYPKQRAMIGFYEKIIEINN